MQSADAERRVRMQSADAVCGCSVRMQCAAAEQWCRLQVQRPSARAKCCMLGSAKGQTKRKPITIP